MPHALITVRVTPRASRNEMTAWSGGVLAVRVTVAPEGGKANAAVCRLVADALRVPKSSLDVVGGGKARTKRLRIEGLEQPEAETRLTEAAPGGGS